MLIYFLLFIAVACVMPLWMGVVSFITWENAFEILGWKFMIRISVILEILLFINIACHELWGH